MTKRIEIINAPIHIQELVMLYNKTASNEYIGLDTYLAFTKHIKTILEEEGYAVVYHDVKDKIIALEK